MKLSRVIPFLLMEGVGDGSGGGEAGVGAGATGGSGEGVSGGAATSGSTGEVASGDGEKSWVEGLDPDLQNYLGNKGWKDPKEVLEGYRNLEKLHGAGPDKLLKLPDTLEGEEARATWERLGAPKEAADYKFELSENVGDEKFAEELKSLAHKHSIPRSKFEGLIKDLSAATDEKMKAFGEERQIELKNQENELRTEWAGEYDKNSNIADLAAKSLGFTPEEIDAIGATLGPAKAMKMLHRLGTATGEAKFAEAGGGRTEVKTPETAKAEINDLIRDQDFQHKLRLKDSDAVARWDRLHQQAAPGQTAI